MQTTPDQASSSYSDFEIEHENKMSYSSSEIFSLLRDEDCVKMLQMIIEHRHPTVSDFGTRKRYYDRLAKLKRARLIAKKNALRAGYEVTPLGAVMYEGLLTLRRAESLRWNFQALDALEETVPSEERKKIMETLVPDEALIKLLRSKVNKTGSDRWDEQ
ncbi:MAG: hypothetical protein WCD28_14135, partial [Nitrososphaeraceae archaeon]